MHNKFFYFKLISANFTRLIDQRILQGVENAPNLTPEENVMKTPNLACWLVFTTIVYQN